MRLLAVVLVFALALLLPLAPPVSAQDQPRRGGELVFAVASEPPSYDGHREETFGLIHPISPFYSLLLRVDPNDVTKIVGDLAERWSVSKDGLTYTIKLRREVKFHDGSPLASRDVKASYDKIIFPPPGVGSARKGQYDVVEAVEAPDPSTVRFRLKWPSASFFSSLASPWNFIYKADILAKDPHWYETHILGSGPFVFVEHVKGSHLVGKKNPDYWDKGKPYLDGFRAIFIPDTAPRVAAIRGERALIEFRGFSPKARDDLVTALGPRILVQESPWDCALWVAINHEKKPFDDQRVRRALTLAMDRWEGSKALSQIAFVKDVGGVQVPGTFYATPEEELTKLAGYWKDPEASRKEARRLLAEAGAMGLSFTFTNRGIGMPYEPVGIWLIDQWRRIGLSVKQEVAESATYFKILRAGEHEVAIDFQCGYFVEPDLDLHKFQSVDKSPANYSRYKDPVLDDLYLKQSRATDVEERKKLVRQFERRLLDEEAHYLITLWYYRIIPHSSRVKGWRNSPSHYINQQLDTVWLAQ